MYRLDELFAGNNCARSCRWLTALSTRWVFLTKTAKKIATSVRRRGAPTAGRLQEIDQFLEGSRTDLLLVADAELFRPADDVAACSRRLQSRQRAFADDIALELGLLQFSAKR
jgi:hypothetical protein